MAEGATIQWLKDPVSDIVGPGTTGSCIHCPGVCIILCSTVTYCGLKCVELCGIYALPK